MITGLEIERGSEVFHAGTQLTADGLQVSGGRVLAVAALGDSVLAAQQAVYQDLEKIAFDGMHFRRDIGYRAIAREANLIDR